MVRKSKQGDGAKVGIAEAIRDVLIASLNKGQFLAALLALIILAIIWKMPEADTAKLASHIVDELVKGYLVGWFLFLLSLIGWYVHLKRQRRMISQEMDRISAERNDLQKLALGEKSDMIKSSQSRR